MKTKRHNLRISRVVELARQKGFRSDTALAAACGLNQGTVSRLLNRKTRPSDDLLDKLARGLGVKREELMRK